MIASLTFGGQTEKNIKKAGKKRLNTIYSHLSFPYGEVAEWSNAADSKSVEGLALPGVRIPPSPP